MSKFIHVGIVRYTTVNNEMGAGDMIINIDDISRIIMKRNIAAYITMKDGCEINAPYWVATSILERLSLYGVDEK